MPLLAWATNNTRVKTFIFSFSLSFSSAAIREMAGRALAVASDNNADALVATLCQLFRDNVPTEEAAPVSWEQDALTAARLQAQWQAQAMLQAQTRHGVAAALGEYAGEMSTASASALFVRLLAVVGGWRGWYSGV